MTAQSDRLDETLVALADPTRRAILSRLARGEARVTEIAAPFAMSLNAVSKHIRTLESAGLVRRRRCGREHLLSFEPRPLDAATAWIAAQRAMWNQSLDALEAMLEAEDRAATSTAAKAPAVPEPAARAASTTTRRALRRRTKPERSNR
jgi:DNA-binding transcriptional ArsR family regulator